MFAILRRIGRTLGSGLGVFVTVIAIGLFAALLYYGTFYTLGTNSKFCLTCHYMKPYYDQWQTSTHQEVACVACHPIRPSFVASTTIRYWLGAHNPRPRAEVKDTACLNEGCHERRLLEGKVRFKKDILFDHKEHVTQIRRGEKLHCTSCHSQIVQGKHIAVTEQVCFLCHFKGAARGQAVTGCPSCHEKPTRVVSYEGFTFSHTSYLKIGVACNQCHLEVARGQGEVPKDRCFACHVERLERYGEQPFLHFKHVTEHYVDCFACHEPIEHGGVRMVETLEVSCEKCHRQKHSPHKEVYMGVGGRGVTDTPSRMFAAQVSCDGCHIYSPGPGQPGVIAIRGDKWEVKRRLCVTCHGPGYDAMLDDWKKVMKEAKTAVAPAVVSARQVLKRLPAKGKRAAEARELLEDAIFNYELVGRGKGAHNIEYAVKLLKAAADQIETAQKMVDGPLVSVKRGPLLGTPDGYCTVLCHNRLGLPEQVTIRDMHIPFTHATHAQGMGIACTVCHSPEKHKERILAKEGCMGCHHTPATTVETCKTCHLTQEGLYLGTDQGYGVAKVKPNSMAPMVDCLGCHDLAAPGPVVTSVRERCIGCHGEAYAEVLTGWEQEALTAISELTLKLEEVDTLLKRKGQRAKNLKQLQQLFAEAKANYQQVDLGGFVHNPPYAQALLQSARKNLDAVAASLQGL